MFNRDVLRAMRKKRAAELPTIILHQDNVAVLEHPLSYGPDLAPCDFFLFPALKQVLHGQQFNDIYELPTVVQSANFSFRRTVTVMPLLSVYQFLVVNTLKKTNKKI